MGQIFSRWVKFFPRWVKYFPRWVKYFQGGSNNFLSGSNISLGGSNISLGGSNIFLGGSKASWNTSVQLNSMNFYIMIHHSQNTSASMRHHYSSRGSHRFLKKIFDLKRCLLCVFLGGQWGGLYLRISSKVEQIWYNFSSRL